MEIKIKGNEITLTNTFGDTYHGEWYIQQDGRIGLKSKTAIGLGYIAKARQQIEEILKNI